LLEEQFGRTFGTTVFKITYCYDNDGNKIEIKHYDYDGNLTNTFLSSYDDQGNLVSENHPYYGLRKYVYNSNGSLIEHSQHNGESEQKTIYKYDENGNNVEMTSYTPDGSLLSKTLSQFDAKGRLISASGYDGEGKLGVEIINRYDEGGNLYETETLNQDYLRIERYDEQGNQIERINYKPSGSVDTTETFRYDDQGNLIERIEQSFSTNAYSRETYVIEYDSYGNWIKKVRHTEVERFGEVQLVPEFAWLRTITYYV
jgi:YD repeat-containing protein